MPRPDVAMITPYPAGVRHGGDSGVASYARNLAEAMRGQGAEVAVIAPRPTGRAPGHPSVRWLTAGPGFLPRAAHAAARTRAPVVHVQHEFFLYGGPGSMPGLPAALGVLRAAGRGPVVTMHHGVDAASVDADFMRLHRVSGPPAAARLGLSVVQAVIRRLSERVIVHEPLFARWIRGATVVPHGLETPAASLPPPADARAALGLDERPLALCLGFIAPYKGLEVALDAARLGHGFQLAVAGGDHPRMGADPYANDLRTRYADVARFPGRIPDSELSVWLAAADVMLLLYPQAFSASGVLALALSHRRPVLLSPALAGATGAAPELRVALEPAAVAGRIEELVRDPHRRAAVVAASDRLATGRSWPEVAERHMRIYGEVGNANGSGRRFLRAA